MSTESVMPSNYLILCHPLLLLPSELLWLSWFYWTFCPDGLPPDWKQLETEFWDGEAEVTFIRVISWAGIVPAGSWSSHCRSVWMETAPNKSHSTIGWVLLDSECWWVGIGNDRDFQRQWHLSWSWRINRLLHSRELGKNTYSLNKYVLITLLYARYSSRQWGHSSEKVPTLNELTF